MLDIAVSIRASTVGREGQSCQLCSTTSSSYALSWHQGQHHFRPSALGSDPVDPADLRIFSPNGWSDNRKPKTSSGMFPNAVSGFAFLLKDISAYRNLPERDPIMSFCALPGWRYSDAAPYVSVHLEFRYPNIASLLSCSCCRQEN